MTTTERATDPTAALELADHIVDLARARAADAEVEVTVRQGTEALTRFATSFIHQNVASEVNHVLVRVALDGRNASTSIDGPADDEGGPGLQIDRLITGGPDQLVGVWHPCVLS